MGFKAYDDLPELSPPNAEGFDCIGNTGDIPPGIGEIVQAHANFGSLEALDQADTIFDNSFEMYSMEGNSPTFQLGAGSMPTFEWNEPGFGDTVVRSGQYSLMP